MNLFRVISIKKKLTLIIMVISSIALLLACFAFILYDLVTFKNTMARDLNILAKVIGTNCTAALTFDSEFDARETLSALRAEGHITAACIYTGDGRVFAKYHRGDLAADFIPPKPQPNSFQFSSSHLTLFQEILLEGKKIGTMYIQSDLGELHSRLKRYALIVAVVLLIASLTAFLMTAKLQKIISTPILHLAKMAKIVSDKKDFSVRATKHSEDELGFLTERFNEMLTQIQDRDMALQKAHHTLEDQARELKKELAGRKRFEKALRKSEERFRDLFDNAPDMYIILDPRGTIIDFNQRGLQALGYETEALVGKPMKNIIHPDDLLNAEKLLRRIQKLGQPPKNIEARLIHKNGEALWVSEEFSLLKTDDGKIQSIRVVCRDITESKKLQEELERAQRLETAGRIAGQIAHDFNNLLGPLAAYPSLIREDLPVNHPIVEMTNEMESAANKIAEINQQLLALGRRGHYTMEPINLNELVDNVLLSQFYAEPNLARTHLEPELLLIKGGAAQLTRALTNLIINAREALQGEGEVTITTENVYLDVPLHGHQTIKRGEYVQLKISDTGTGIKPEIMDKIFDPFFTTKTMDRMRGSGLGLSVVHGVIEDHKGYITVDSTVGKGTTFSLYFPVTRDVQKEVATIVDKIEGGQESILIVDDDPIQRRVTGQLLKRLGYKIHSTPSGELAVDYVKEVPQNLLILDMAMDGVDGTETYRQILEFQPDQRAIILSGYAMTKRVEQALKLGAGSFVSKPISLKNLAMAVRKELDRAK
ncbi:MAG: PAS domain S-box protein [bacterium]